MAAKVTYSLKISGNGVNKTFSGMSSRFVEGGQDMVDNFVGQFVKLYPAGSTITQAIRSTNAKYETSAAA